MTEEIKNILLSFKRVFVSHVYYKGNVVVDWIANEAIRRDTSHRWPSGERFLIATKILIDMERIQGRKSNIKCNYGS